MWTSRTTSERSRARRRRKAQAFRVSRVACIPDVGSRNMAR